MFRSKISNYFLWLIFLFSLSSCGLFTRVISEPTVISDIESQNLFNKLSENEVKYNTAEIKYRAVIEQKGQKNSFAGVMRIKKDSVIWITANVVFGIEVARIALTKDSVILLNRLSSTYYKGDYKQLQTDFGVNLNYLTIEAILFNRLYLYPNGKINSSKDLTIFNYYTDSTHIQLIRPSPKQLSHLTTTGDTLNLITQQFDISKYNYKIEHSITKEYISRRTMNIHYSNFQAIENTLLPIELVIALSEKDENTTIEFLYGKIELNKKLTFPFSIPDTYKPF